MTRTVLAQQLSLIDGWLPITVEVVTALVLVTAIGRRTRSWLLLWTPIAVVLGVGTAAATHWFLQDQGLAGDKAPPSLWIWLACTCGAVVLAIAGWPRSPWWRRAVAIVAIVLTALCTGLAVNLWVGYLPTVQSAVDRVTGRSVPGKTDTAGVAQLQAEGRTPGRGTPVSVSIPATASGFKHRDEFVYLPPAWYASTPPPALPVIVMFGGEIGGPADWIQSGGAVKTLDDFAASHGGVTPVVVFVDTSGSFSNDTECVNGVRGNAADHITKDVIPYVVETFKVSTNPANWGAVGWSTGGTCAITFTVAHPELFSNFVSIDGQLGPNAGTRTQTIARLFGGDAEAWARFDPETVMVEHGPYTGAAGWFAVSADTPTVYRSGQPPDPSAAPVLDPQQQSNTEDHAFVANHLCGVAAAYGIECAVKAEGTKHDFPSAAAVFSETLPWLAGRLGTPGVPPTPLPGAPSRP